MKSVVEETCKPVDTSCMGVLSSLANEEDSILWCSAVLLF